MRRSQTSRDVVIALLECEPGGRKVEVPGLGTTRVRIRRGGIRTVELTLPGRGRVEVELGPGEAPEALMPNAVRQALWAAKRNRLRAAIPLLGGGRG